MGEAELSKISLSLAEPGRVSNGFGGVRWFERPP